MVTTLPQRLKAARQYADLRQQDIADACALAGIKVSRSAVAQWEYEDERRTQPSIDHVKVVAKRTGVPLEWLLSDSADLADIWRITKLNEPMPQAPPVVSPVQDRMLDSFTRAVEFALAQRRPDMVAAFGRSVVQSGMTIQPGFAWGNVIADFRLQPVDADTIGRLLMAEQALSRKAKKAVILLDPSQQAVSEVFGVTVYPVPSPDRAAETLISLCE